MSKLQELLDARWPMGETDGDAHWKKAALRYAFTEGYNAAMQELSRPSPNNPEYDLKKVLTECHKMISEGRHIGALRLLKETMGYSLTDAKNILNL